MNGEFDIEHRQIERLFQEQHAMRGRARRDRQIEHESEEAEPQRLHALGRTVERGDQPRPLSCRARCRRFGKPSRASSSIAALALRGVGSRPEA
jgi:hypothetical protein